MGEAHCCTEPSNMEKAAGSGVGVFASQWLIPSSSCFHVPGREQPSLSLPSPEAPADLRRVSGGGERGGSAGARTDGRAGGRTGGREDVRLASPSSVSASWEGAPGAGLSRKLLSQPCVALRGWKFLRSEAVPTK